MLRLFVILLSFGYYMNFCAADVNTEYHSVRTIIDGGRIRKRQARFDVETIMLDKKGPEVEKDPEYWRTAAYEQLEKNLKRQKLNKNKAKNIIFFLGDGMSLSTVAAARILKGQKKQHTGEEESLFFENFPYTGLSKTYCTNAQVADSACTATAYLCGVKGNILTIGVTAKVNFNNCSASMDPANQVSSIAAWAQKAGKSTGFVTTTTLTHASPAGTYAHVANRLYESDADVKKYGQNPNTCMDMAQQLVTQEPGRNFNVMMGGGMGKFLPNTVIDAHGNKGERLDGKHLLYKWKNMHSRGTVVTNRDQLMSVDPSKVSHLMGIFQSKSMEYHALAYNTKQPTLSEMTQKAIEILKRNEKGYFVFIEGGHIDTAHHENKAAISLDETLEFAEAIQLARHMTDPEDTLVVVSSDHGHPMTIAGYPERGTPILGLNQHDISSDGLKYATISYPLGPEQYVDPQTGRRLDLESKKFDINTPYPSYIKSTDGHHSGDDVGIFASGPFDHLFTGVMEQSTIPHLMGYAACIGDGPKMCDGSKGK